jgi:hypothetical protein
LAPPITNRKRRCHNRTGEKSKQNPKSHAKLLTVRYGYLFEGSNAAQIKNQDSIVFLSIR